MGLWFSQHEELNRTFREQLKGCIFIFNHFSHVEEFKIASSTDDWDLIFITIWHIVALYQWLWDGGEKNHECTFQEVVSAWPHLALSFSMKIHFLPGFHPFIFSSHPSSNWAFHLTSTVYSSYGVKSWKTFENVKPDNELQLIPQSTKEKDSSSFSTDKNFKKKKTTKP